MILYVNGDSHTAAAEAVNPHCFAEDDGDLYHLGRRPHPSNLAVSWGWELSRSLHAEFYCDAEAASSNARIIRTTRDWIRNNFNRLDRTLVIIQWSTWEREEWMHAGQRYQVNASGIDHVPPELQTRYKQFVASIHWPTVQNTAHYEIWNFHRELKDKGIKHVFFNGNSHFASQPNQFDWGNCYLGPYDPSQTYDLVLKNNGFKTVNPQSWHFGPEAHSFWASFMLQYLQDHNIVTAHALSTH